MRQRFHNDCKTQRIRNATNNSCLPDFQIKIPSISFVYNLPITSTYIRCVLPIRCESFDWRGRQKYLPHLASLSRKVTISFLLTAVGGRLVSKLTIPS